jgi:small subunit ribosomal protein S2
MAIPTPQELIKAGVHLGHQKSKWNPKMSPFVFGVRNNFHIIDVFKTAEKLEEAINFAKEVIQSGGKILFIGVKVQTKDIVRETAKSINMPYVAGRWLGGLFTNFKVVRERIDYLKDLEKRREDGEIEKYTKKEQLNFERQFVKLEEELGGLKDLSKLPNAIFVSDLNREKIAVLEAKKMNIPVIAVVDTDGDPNLVEYPIPANDSAISSVNIIYNTVKEELSGIKPLVVSKEVLPDGQVSEDRGSDSPNNVGKRKSENSNSK